MERVCFTLQVRDGCLAEYAQRHAEVWPEMRQALWDAGWHNYSIFARPDGLVIGYFETDDFDAALAAMDGLAINARWQAEMAPLVQADEGRRVDESLNRLPMIFQLHRDPADER
ncbi:L-rhamnose mutarotase [Microlunatus ginsengisoli]|uniref:L-rhamnose mutarotase n=1 Tax=Microlunatus ginsengisoli TaxID=363863 RepID=A0ABP6ZLC2_9ACTN